MKNVFEDFSALRKVGELSSSETFFTSVLRILNQIERDSETFEKFTKRGARTASPPALHELAGGNGLRLCQKFFETHQCKIFVKKGLTKVCLFFLLLIWMSFPLWWRETCLVLVVLEFVTLFSIHLGNLRLMVLFLMISSQIRRSRCERGISFLRFLHLNVCLMVSGVSFSVIVRIIFWFSALFFLHTLAFIACVFNQKYRFSVELLHSGLWFFRWHERWWNPEFWFSD